MAKFCKYCGAQLEDNQQCTCEASKAATAPAPAQAPAPVQNVAQAQTSADIQNYFKDVLNSFLSIIKTPFSGSVNFVKANKFYVSLGYIALYTLVSALTVMFAMIMLNSIISPLTSAFSLFSSSLTSMVAFPIFKSFVASIILVAGFTFLVPAVQLVVFKIMKIEANYKSLLNCTATSCAIQIPLLVVAMLMLILASVIPFFATIGLLLISIGHIFGLIVSFLSLQGASDAGMDKLAIVFGISYAAHFIIMTIVLSLAMPLFMPRGLSALGGLGSGLGSSLGDFSSLF